MARETSLNIAIVGATGRIGRRLCALVHTSNTMNLVGAVSLHAGKALKDVEPELSSCDIIISNSLLSILPKPHVVIDFSLPECTIKNAHECATLDIPLIIGTTGLTELQSVELKNLSSRVPIIHAMNFSLGVNLLCLTVANVAKRLGEDFNVEIIEAHHNLKLDAPSGTALALADSILDATGRTRDNLVHGRVGRVGERTSSEIGMHAVRLGSVIGDHTVLFGSDCERLEFTHKAQNKDTFAVGAIKAAEWINGKSPGWYSMRNVLEL